MSLDYIALLRDAHLYHAIPRPRSERIRSELVLGNEDDDLGDGAAHELAVVIDLHAQIQLDLLWPRDAARQHQHRLRRRRSPQVEAGLRGAHDTRRRAHVHQRHGELYRRFRMVISPHGEELQLAGARDRQHAHEGDEVVRVVQG